MSSLTMIEKRRLEDLLGMASGYVLDFSNQTFSEFVDDAVRRDIYDEKYSYASGSKANRLRAFWSQEPDHLTAKLLAALIDYAAELEAKPEQIEACRTIVERLEKAAPVADLDAIAPNADGRDFETLAQAVRQSIDNNEPEAGLDRLHTFTVRYLRVLCEKRGIQTPLSKPLHSLLGELLKSLKNEGLVESQMAERILKSSISILDAFNHVRNNQSLAHDNELLTYDEALLIFNNISSTIRFLTTLERRPKPADPTPPSLDDDVPF